MEEQIIDDEQAKHFIGNLLHDDDNLSTHGEVRNVPTNRSNISNSSDFMRYTDGWQNDAYVSTQNQGYWDSDSNDFLFKSYTSVGPNDFNIPPEYQQKYNFYGTNWHNQSKPMATVPPFDPSEEETHNNLNHSPVSESVTSDSGTISPEPKAKTKWKKLDLATDMQELNIPPKQTSDPIQSSAKTYSSVAQQSKAITPTVHKRISGSNSVPLSNTSTGKRTSKGKVSKSTNSGSQPVTPDEAKPPKIIGLNPISSTHVFMPIVRPVIAPPVIHSVSNTSQSGDFQKIKRKKGKTSVSKLNIKNDAEHKPTRFMALAQQPLPIDDLEDEALEDDEDDSEYFLRVEAQKEEMRAKARAELAACNSTDAEKAARMQKLENDMKLMFATKRRQTKVKPINRQRIKRTGYTIIFPEYVKSFLRLVSKSLYWIAMFMFNLISDVAERSLIALMTFARSSKEMFIDLNSYFLNGIRFLISRMATEIYEHIRYAAIDEPIEYQIGLLQNSLLPTCCEDIIERLYTVNNADAYSVLGLTKDCTDDDIQKYYNSVREFLKPEIHSNVGLSEALVLIDTAYNFVSTSLKRREYDSKLEQLPQTYELQRDLDDLRALINSKGSVLHCECGDSHPIVRAQNHPGRYCSKDRIHHPPKNGDIWIEKRCFGLLRVCFAAINGAIYDISKWNDCSVNRILINKTDLHHPAYRFYSNAGSNSCLSNNGIDRHRCSALKSDGTECIMFSKDTPIPVESLCCCNLAVCSIPENVILQNVPCCFGTNLVAYHTASASASGEKSDDRARRAGRRRLVRR